jgi:hypothetical protein
LGTCYYEKGVWRLGGFQFERVEFMLIRVTDITWMGIRYGKIWWTLNTTPTILISLHVVTGVHPNFGKVFYGILGLLRWDINGKLAWGLKLSSGRMFGWGHVA